MTGVSDTSWRNADPTPYYRTEVHYGHRIVQSRVPRAISLYSMAADAARRTDVGEALVDGSFRTDWPGLVAYADRVAAGFARKGIGRGDRVVLFLSNCAEFVVILFALNKIGAIVVPVGTREQADGLGFVIRDCAACAIVSEEGLAGIVQSACEGLDLLSICFCTDSVDANLEAIISGDCESKAPCVPVSEDDIAVLIYTSGTTGRPKGVMISNFNLVHAGLIYASTMGLGPEDRAILVVPLSHVTGIAALVANMTAAGGTMILLQHFDAAAFLETAVRERMTYTILVPAMYNLCLARADMAAMELSRWRVGGYGGAQMPVATIDRLATALPGLGLMNCYGATETVMAVAILPSEYSRTHSDCVGLAVAGSTVKCMNDGVEAAAGQPGELWIAGPTVSPGYWKRAEATRESFVGGYWRSGDVGSIDSEGFVRVFDRLKDMINRGGYKIFSAEVENAIMAVNGVVEAAVVGYPCPILGERVAAFIVMKEACRSDAFVKLLREKCSRTLADYKCPERYEVVADALPRNANGKVQKNLLRGLLK